MVSQTIAATPPLLSLKMAYRSPKTELTRGVSQEKLASEAYRTLGGVARNSIANRTIVGHKAREIPVRGGLVPNIYPYLLPFVQKPSVSHNSLVAHDCGYTLSRYTCRATRVAADSLDFIAFCRCSTSVALHPLKTLVSHLAPPPVAPSSLWLSSLSLSCAPFSTQGVLASLSAGRTPKRYCGPLSGVSNGIMAVFLGYRAVLSSFFLGFEVVFRDSCRDRD